ncbi:MAG: response regulator [Alphaproteobacteria bacterium]|nr:response regulator [Alphaproteobacteria bacterium]
MSESLAPLDGFAFLVLDDNRYARKTARDILRAFGANEVHEAADGAAGLNIVAQHRPDAVICDLMMTPMDGIEFVRRLRHDEDSPLPFMPIVMTTANASAATVAAARDAGVNEFLAKPITTDALLRRVVAALTPRPFIRTRVFFGPDRRRKTIAGFIGPDRRQAEPVDVSAEEIRR